MLIALLTLMVGVELPVRVSSDVVEIGEPVVCSVEVGALGGARPTLDGVALDPGVAWVLLDPPTLHSGVEGAATWTWTVMALEPNPGALPVPVIAHEGAPVTLVAPRISVAAALDEGEDAPRPARGFHIPSVESERALVSAWWVALFVLVLVGWAAWMMKRRRSPVAAVDPGPVERLTALGSAPDLAGPELVAWHAELTRILRSAHSDDRAGWSDAEWIERAALDPQQRAELRELLAVCAAVKYGGARPTRFAVEETMERARLLITRSQAAAEVAA